MTADQWAGWGLAPLPPGPCKPETGMSPRTEVIHSFIHSTTIYCTSYTLDTARHGPHWPWLGGEGQGLSLEGDPWGQVGRPMVEGNLSVPPTVLGPGKDLLRKSSRLRYKSA